MKLRGRLLAGCDGGTSEKDCEQGGLRAATGATAAAGAPLRRPWSFQDYLSGQRPTPDEYARASSAKTSLGDCTATIATTSWPPRCSRLFGDTGGTTAHVHLRAVRLDRSSAFRRARPTKSGRGFGSRSSNRSNRTNSRARRRAAGLAAASASRSPRWVAGGGCSTWPCPSGACAPAQGAKNGSVGAETSRGLATDQLDQACERRGSMIGRWRRRSCA